MLPGKRIRNACHQIRNTEYCHREAWPLWRSNHLRALTLVNMNVSYQMRSGKEMISGRKYKMTVKENTAILKILTVSNKVGKDQCTCSVNVIGLALDDSFDIFPHTDRAVPPSFTRPLKKVDARIGSNVTLDCRVAGSQPLVVSWYKDNKEIHSDDKYQVDFSESTASVTVTGLEKSDAGVYTCRASNDAGEKETSGTLSIKGQRSWISKESTGN
uniref:Ig-like domain-containing protein n=1 Tax=Sparus aurata TaxID=8175 RepID=A0A671TN10_SPAAU